MSAEQTFRHTADMGEISGFGGGYEECCQDMLEAGVKWLNEHKPQDLRAKGLKGVYGIFIPNSPEAEDLDGAVVAAAKGEATGAMHHAVMSRLFYIAKNGWDKYCEEVRGAEKTDAA